MGEASISDLQDVLKEIPQKEHRNFLEAMRLSLPDEDDDDDSEVNAIDALKNWKKDQGVYATRNAVVQAVKRLKDKHVLKTIEEMWQGKEGIHSHFFPFFSSPS